MKNGMIKIGMFEAYLERMLIRGLKVAYISYFTRTLQEAKAIGSTMCTSESNTIWLNKSGPVPPTSLERALSTRKKRSKM